MPLYSPQSHLFVDECKAKGYYIAATAAASSEAPKIDRALKQLLLPGQGRIHFTKEQDPRRRKLLAQFAALDIEVTVYVTKGLRDNEARRQCLTELAADAVESQAQFLRLEKDDTLVRQDTKTLTDAFAGHRDRPRFEHVSPNRYALLWVSDAVAWCYQAGGDWWRRAQPLVTEVKKLS
ncbi:MAG: hypothetical protein ACOC84_02985 [Actinomycetota bacterium]